jgi:hypothetical protein
MKRSGVMVQASVVILLVALVGLGAGGLYTYSSSSGSGNTTGSPNTQTSQYLGYIPKGYSVAPLLPNSPQYPCPSNLNSTQCTQFKASCGNGVCDPNETCGTCPIDCGVPQGLSCDPYTGRASGLGGICELSIPYSNTQPGQNNPVLNNPGAPGQAAGG